MLFMLIVTGCCYTICRFFVFSLSYFAQTVNLKTSLIWTVWFSVGIFTFFVFHWENIKKSVSSEEILSFWSSLEVMCSWCPITLMPKITWYFTLYHQTTTTNISMKYKMALPMKKESYFEFQFMRKFCVNIRSSPKHNRWDMCCCLFHRFKKCSSS